METAQFYIMERVDGTPVNYKYEPVKSVRTAARFSDKEHFEAFLTGYYAPTNPDDYVISLVRATYEKVNENE